jgi:hypothetical protein
MTKYFWGCVGVKLGSDHKGGTVGIYIKINLCVIYVYLRSR